MRGKLGTRKGFERKVGDKKRQMHMTLREVRLCLLLAECYSEFETLGHQKNEIPFSCEANRGKILALN